MFNELKAVIFDLDGTIVDSMWIWKQIDIDYLTKRGIQLPDDLQREIEGMSFTETAIYFKKRFNLKETIDEIKSEWSSMAYDYYKNRVQLKDGVKQFIEYMKFQDKKLGIGTSNAKELAVEVLKAHNILHYFDTLRTSCEVKKGKPNPDVFLKVAEDLKVKPENCLVFEDTYAGVLAAKRAGMRVFAVADELSFPYKKEISKLADKYIESFIDIA